MSTSGPHSSRSGPEIIESDKVISPGKVGFTEGMRLTSSIVLAFVSLFLASGLLIYGVQTKTTELITWSTNLISAIAGAAISYGFNKNK